MQGELAARQYTQHFLAVADEKLQFTSPKTLSISKHTLSYYNCAGELRRVFFSDVRHNLTGHNRLYVRVVLTSRKSNVISISLGIWG